MANEAIRQQLYESYQNRALLYYLIFDEIRRELGADKAEEIMKRAIYRRGVQKSSKYARCDPPVLERIITEPLVGGEIVKEHLIMQQPLTEGDQRPP